MKVVSITATCGRHRSLERCVSLLKDQDFEGDYTILIYNNHESSLKLDKGLEGSNIKLINNSIDLVTGQRYTNLGAIYRDALTYVDEDTDIVNHADDDDLYYPNHISEGVKGYIRNGLKCYKPENSYYRDGMGLHRVNNVLEPSMFVAYSWLKEYGYKQSTSDQHLQWLDALIAQKQIIVDPKGIPTLIYNWGDDYYAYKTSGNTAGDNFGRYRKESQDIGDRMISLVKFKLPDRK